MMITLVIVELGSHAKALEDTSATLSVETGSFRAFGSWPVPLLPGSRSLFLTMCVCGGAGQCVYFRGAE